MKKHHRYSEEEELFLRESISQFDCYADLTAAFNELFDCGLTRQSIQDKCTKRMRICIGKNKAQFRAGGRQRAVPIGTIRKTVNATYIKVSDVATGITGYAAPDWIPLQQKIWEDYNGKMPDGHMICFLDCNKENFSIENLCCIDRRISAILARNKWYSDNPEITLTAIKWCELHYALQDCSQGYEREEK